MSEESDDSTVSSEDVDLEIPEEDQQDPDMDEWWTWSNFARLFIVPLIIVVLAVTIYGFFQFMVGDRRAVGEYINVIKSGEERARWRAAFDLAQRVQRDDAGKDLTFSEVQQIIDLYRDAEQSKVRMYLARVLGHIPTPQARQALVEGLGDSAVGVRVNSLLALGQLGASQEVDHIKPLLDDDRAEVRRMAAYVLGSLGNDSVVESLKQTLEDPIKDVRWNSAIALARLGNDAGQPILMDNLKQASNGGLGEMGSRNRSNLLVNTIRALMKINATEALPILRTMKENDPAPPVREQALEAIESMEGKQTA